MVDMSWYIKLDNGMYKATSLYRSHHVNWISLSWFRTSGRLMENYIHSSMVFSMKLWYRCCRNLRLLVTGWLGYIPIHPASLNGWATPASQARIAHLEVRIHMGVSWNRGTPSSHPFWIGVFPSKAPSHWGTPIFRKPSRWWYLCATSTAPSRRPRPYIGDVSPLEKKRGLSAWWLLKRLIPTIESLDIVGIISGILIE